MSPLHAIRQEALRAQRRFQRPLWAVVTVVLLLLPLVFSSSYAITIMTQMTISIIFALSYNMLLGQGGMLSFGHAVYFGMGGFLAMHGMNIIADGELPVPVALLPIFGGLIGLAFGLIFGAFSVRRAGTVFAMISLGIAELVAASGLIFVRFFGGEEGIIGDRTLGPPIFGFELLRDIEVYYVAAFWTLVAAFAMYKFSRTPVGRLANAVRDNPERAEFIGYSQQRVRYVSFAMSGFFAGVAGGIFAIAYEILTEETLNVNTSGEVLLMTFIGGVGFYIGPIVGAIFLTLLRTLLSNFTEIWLLYVGFIFVGTVVFAPQGLTGLIMMHGPAYHTRRLRHLVKPYLLMSLPLLVCLTGIVGLLELGHFIKSRAAGEYLFSFFFLPLNADSLLPWITLLAMVGLGGYGARRLFPSLRDAWDLANAPLPPASPSVANPPAASTSRAAPTPGPEGDPGRQLSKART
jgi:branched-chain amino acid transport system permease protein|tara:strand:- start:2532 stop:3917 length:1386 start_codon:yes stop_codon:yes gene_type:complete